MRIDGVDVRELTHAALTDAVAVVPQSTFLFDDSVRENVTLGEAVPDADIWAALRIVQAEGFVSPCRRGSTSSSASAAPRSPAANASGSPWRVPSSAGLGCSSWTTPPAPSTPRSSSASSAPSPPTRRSGRSVGVVVAYRKATIALADEVVFLADGRVADRGTHAELIARSDDYRLLVDAYDTAARPRCRAVGGRTA